MSGASPTTGPFDTSWARQKDCLCDQFENAWPGPPRPKIEDYLGHTVEPQRSQLLRELLTLELELRLKSGEEPTFDEYERRFPGHVELLKAVLFDAGCLPLEWIGRFKVIRRLGGGGFGQVYLCWDDNAERNVAIKLPRRDRLTSAEAMQAMLHEARLVAQLKHPGIVQLYDVSEHEDQCFLVYEFIEGGSLEDLMKARPALADQGARLIARVAKALNHVHERDRFHRDIKPANILLDRQRKPYVTDFGLAVRTEELPRQRGMRTGTYPYMAPEQVRGEGDRIDGRTDIYSLGVVLYELLCGRRPFRGSKSEVFDQILNRDPQPPRQINHRIDPALERICLKALAKEANARYPTAGDMAEALLAAAPRRRFPAEPGGETETDEPDERTPPPPQSKSVRVLPKGLRSFSAEDSEFFLELLPGPRDGKGLPDPIRFWKTLIETRDADAGFAVGLIYGPSGCGKSSLIKAGLLPKLASSVLPVYVEATRENTEARLTRELQTCLETSTPLPEMLAQLRGGRPLPLGKKKLLIVLDQFEQWLHAHGHDMESTDLVAALRRADGEHVQVILMVRADFSMSISRLFDSLEINIDHAHNARAVDLFDADHARHVLHLFGHAYREREFPIEPKDLTKDQADFLTLAVKELSEDGHVIPVRLSLFADMMKKRPWTPDELEKVGGAKGIGVKFLEESFTHPDLLARKEPAQALLQALLPAPGADIKGRTRSSQELATASELAETSRRFARLLEILGGELHIITPTDPPIQNPVSPANSPADRAHAPQATYQLTHDYLVPALRQWLTEERRKTWRGRAELCLEERMAQYHRMPEPRFLPSASEYVTIALAVPRRKRTPEQRALLNDARRYYAFRWGGTLAIVLALAIGFLWYDFSVQSATRVRLAEIRINNLLTTSAQSVPSAIERLKLDKGMVRPLLQTHFRDPASYSRKLRAACALSAFGDADQELQEFLVGAVATASANECENIVSALRPLKDAVAEPLLTLAHDSQASDFTRVRYATVLLHLGDAGAAQAILAVTPNPRERTTFIHSFKSWHGDLRLLAQMLRDADDPALCAGLCAALGLIEADTLDSDEGRALQEALLHLYQHADDAGTHSASGWTLRQWKMRLPDIGSRAGAAEGRHWFINRQGMTMLEIKPGAFLMGDATDELISGATAVGVSAFPQGQGSVVAVSGLIFRKTVDDSEDKPHQVTLTRPFFMCDREVTVEQFQKFMNDPGAEKPEWPGPNLGASPTDDCPVQYVSWTDVVMFCNWLSQREELEPCYVRTGAKEKVRVLLKNKWQEVETDVWYWKPGTNGYRLPNEAEWEYACRAGAVTMYSFGDNASLLPHYGVFRSIHTAPGGSRLPNAWGLFDMHGNVSEWCWDRVGKYPDGPVADPRGAETGITRALRGGYYTAPPEQCSSAFRAGASPPERGPMRGFRVVCAARETSIK